MVCSNQRRGSRRAASNTVPGKGNMSDPASRESTQTAAEPTRPEGVPATAPRDVSFYCSVCGSHLTAPASLQGNPFQCPLCSRETQVPTRPLAEGESPCRAATAGDRRILLVKARPRCPGCNSKLAVDETAGLALGDCPRCGTEVVLAISSGRTPASAGDDQRSDAAPSPAGDSSWVLSPEEVQLLTGTS